MVELSQRRDRRRRQGPWCDAVMKITHIRGNVMKCRLFVVIAVLVAMGVGSGGELAARGSNDVDAMVAAVANAAQNVSNATVAYNNATVLEAMTANAMDAADPKLASAERAMRTAYDAKVAADAALAAAKLPGVPASAPVDPSAQARALAALTAAAATADHAYHAAVDALPSASAIAKAKADTWFEARNNQARAMDNWNSARTNYDIQRKFLDACMSGK